MRTFKADMEAKKGAPVYSRHPPMVPTQPDWPLDFSPAICHCQQLKVQACTGVKHIICGFFLDLSRNISRTLQLLPDIWGTISLTAWNRSWSLGACIFHQQSTMVYINTIV